MKRRYFFGAAAAASTWLAGKAKSFGRGQDPAKTSFWNGGYFQQKTVDMRPIETGIIRARVDGRWESYTIRSLDDAFFGWNIGDRKEKLAVMKGGAMPAWSGSHNAAVATYGYNRGDSCFTLNNAIKGTGLCPKKEALGDLTERLASTQSLGQNEKFATFEWMYSHPELWDRTRLVSLELYAAPDFEPHTFLNQMENPISTLVYLDVPSYEIRAVARLMHPDDPELSPYERQMTLYINSIHTYMHSQFKKIVPAVLYFAIEEFDNSPAGRGGEGKRGKRVV